MTSPPRGTRRIGGSNRLETGFFLRVPRVLRGGDLNSETRSQGSSAEHSRNGGECVEKPPHARIARGRDDPGTIAGDQLTLFDHADAIAERERLTHVVRDDDHGLANALLNPAEFRVELGARQRIERAEWLVH